MTTIDTYDELMALPAGSVVTFSGSQIDDSYDFVNEWTLEDDGFWTVTRSDHYPSFVGFKTVGLEFKFDFGEGYRFELVQAEEKAA